MRISEALLAAVSAEPGAQADSSVSPTLVYRGAVSVCPRASLLDLGCDSSPATARAC